MNVLHTTKNFKETKVDDEKVMDDSKHTIIDASAKSSSFPEKRVFSMVLGIVLYRLNRVFVIVL